MNVQITADDRQRVVGPFVLIVHALQTSENGLSDIGRFALEVFVHFVQLRFERTKKGRLRQFAAAAVERAGLLVDGLMVCKARA